MKKLIAIVGLALITSGAFAQGVIAFNNGVLTKVQVNGVDMPASPAGSYYFALLTAPAGTVDPLAFTFSGAYATNRANTAGAIVGGTSVAVSGWAPGVTLAVEVAGWSADLGAVWNPAWLQGTFAGASGSTVFGLSMIAPVMAGGGAQSLPPGSVFGGTGITAPFNLVPVPEPTSMALAGLGAAAMLIFRRRK